MARSPKLVRINHGYGPWILNESLNGYWKDNALCSCVREPCPVLVERVTRLARPLQCSGGEVEITSERLCTTFCVRREPAVNIIATAAGFVPFTTYSRSDDLCSRSGVSSNKLK